MALTDKHIRVRDFILEYQRTHGRKPLWKEIAPEFHISEKTLSKYLTRLEAAGELKLEYVAPQGKSAGA